MHMKKRKVLVFGCTGLFLIILLLVVSILYPNMKKEVQSSDRTEIIQLRDIFSQDGKFYVYFYQDECPYCENITEAIDEFKKINKVYLVNTNQSEEMKRYDWDKHASGNDIEIGEKPENGEAIFYNNLDKPEIMMKYPPLKYRIVLADYDYAKLYPDKKIGKIYAISTHPQLSQTELEVDNFTLPGVPMLIEVDNHNVANYYFDDKEIIDFLDSDVTPKDSYWGLG